jgi:hypothetical protein
MGYYDGTRTPLKIIIIKKKVHVQNAGAPILKQSTTYGNSFYSKSTLFHNDNCSATGIVSDIEYGGDFFV